MQVILIVLISGLGIKLDLQLSQLPQKPKQKNYRPVPKIRPIPKANIMGRTQVDIIPLPRRVAK